MTGKQKLAKIKGKDTGVLSGITGNAGDKGPMSPPQVGHRIGSKFYESMPVLMLRFPPTAPQNLHGKNSCTSVTSNVEGKLPRTNHTIDFLPELNQFRVVYHGQAGAEPKIDLVPMHRVDGWTPFDAGETYLVPGSKA